MYDAYNVEANSPGRSRPVSDGVRAAPHERDDRRDPIAEVGNAKKMGLAVC